MRKLSLVLVFILVFSMSLFPKTKLYMGFMTQFGLSGSTTNQNKMLPEDFRNFDTGFIFNIGLRNYINEAMGYSMLLDLGYYHDSYEFKHESIEGGRLIESYQFENFLVGASARFHFSFLSIGVGGGAKIPTMGYYSKETLTARNRYYLSYGDLNDIFEHVVIPYIKVSLDFSILNYLILGAYVNYDFPISMKANNYLSSKVINTSPMSALDIGLQFGYFISFDRD